MAARFGLSIDEGLGLVKWLVEYVEVDFVKISGGNAENKASKLHSKTRVIFIDYKTANRTLCKIHSEGNAGQNFKDLTKHLHMRDVFNGLTREGSRIGLNGLQTLERRLWLSSWHAHATVPGVCSLIGLGRSALLQPDLPAAIPLNQSIPDEDAFAQPHIAKGQYDATLYLLHSPFT